LFCQGLCRQFTIGHRLVSKRAKLSHGLGRSNCTQVSGFSCFPLRLCAFAGERLAFPSMRFRRPLLFLPLLALIVGAVSLWLNLPSPVDMADYAPADSLVYVE